MPRVIELLLIVVCAILVARCAIFPLVQAAWYAWRSANPKAIVDSKRAERAAQVEDLADEIETQRKLKELQKQRSELDQFGEPKDPKKEETP
jgi:hypothetical protein